MNNLFLAALLLCAGTLHHVTSFQLMPTPSNGRRSSFGISVQQRPAFFSRRLDLGAGFGGGGGGDKKKKEVKIKPKAQWDRYTGELKKAKPFRVAVKAEGKDSDEWLEVGNVKSNDNEFTKAAVARQRALIAEHARRLFPLQVSTKDKIEWAYWDAEGDDWVIVDKTVLDDSTLPDGLEKLIGFEGRPDPASGFYCMYNEGKLVNSDEDLKKRSGSKKLQ